MRKSTILLGLLSLGCALSAIWAWQQFHAQRERANALETRLAGLESRARVPIEHSSAVAPMATPAPAPKAVAASGTATKRSTPDGNELVRQWQQREREMLRDPAYRQAQVEQHRRRYSKMRADAIRVVGMSPEQADRIVDMQVERELQYSERGPLTADENQVATEAAVAELRTLLGDEKLARWREYQRSESVRAEVNAWSAQNMLGAEPLRDQQVDALVTTIFSERDRLSREYEEYVRAAGITDRYVVAPQDRQRYLDLNRAANQRIHDAATGTLTSQQLAGLDDILNGQLVPIEAALRLQLEGRLAKSQ